MKNFKKMITIGKEEFNSASKVIKSGQLSFFLEKKIKISRVIMCKNLEGNKKIL